MPKEPGFLLKPHEIVFGLAILYGIYHFTFSFGTPFVPPEELVGQDYRCEHRGRGGYNATGVVWGAQTPATLIDYLRKPNLSELENQEIIGARHDASAVVNLNDSGHGNIDFDPLVVHVLSTDKTGTDLPLYSVRALNKGHKGEIWYIAASNINRETKVQ